MTEYIDKAAAVRILEAKSDMAVCTDAQPYFAAAAKMIGLLPSADVAPVVHARWRYTDAYPHQVWCPNCNRKFLPNMEWIGIYNIPTNYCPCCGAIMDESEDEE